MNGSIVVAAIAEGLLAVGIAFIAMANTSLSTMGGAPSCYNPSPLFGCPQYLLIYYKEYSFGLFFLVVSAFLFLFALWLFRETSVTRSGNTRGDKTMNAAPC